MADNDEEKHTKTAISEYSELMPARCSGVDTGHGRKSRFGLTKNKCGFAIMILLCLSVCTWYAVREKKKHAARPAVSATLTETGNNGSRVTPQILYLAEKLSEEGKVLYDSGIYEEALGKYLEAYAKGRRGDEARISDMYYYGRGVARNYTVAMKWAEKAAESGNGYGQYRLGVMYWLGEGVRKNRAEAEKWFLKALENCGNMAERGNADCQFAMGVMQHMGLGMKQDYAGAVNWYRKAAEQDHADAQLNLGVMYEYGYGVKKDYTEAFKWYSKAAEHGISSAQNNLGYLYSRGYGVPKDISEAVKWYEKAAAQGLNTARENLRKLKN